ncbi:tetratricopeptide repeat protein [bacterium]|nr:tetratricopeptide repeat protein [bacterium]
MRSKTSAGEFDRALAIGDSLQANLPEGCRRLPALYLQKGRIHTETEQFEQAFVEYHKALQLSANKPELLIEINVQIGSLHRRAASHEKALKYLRKAIAIAKEHHIDSLNGELYNAYGNVLSSHEIDSSIYYYKQAIIWYGDSCFSCRRTIFNNIGSNYAKIGDYELAISFFDKAYQLDSTHNDSFRLMRTLFNLGRVEYIYGKHNQAQGHLKLAIKLAQIYKWKLSIPFMVNMLGGMKAAEGQNEAAYQYFMRAATIDDSLLHANSAEAIANALASYELEEAEMKNKLLQQENEIIKKETQFRTYTLLFVLVVALILGLLVFYISRKRKELRHFSQSLDAQNEKLKELIKEKDNLMGMLTHDLKTPLGNLKTILYMLREEGLSGAERNELFEDANSSAEAGLDLINDLLAVYREETQNLELNLSEIDFSVFLKALCQQYKVQALAKEQSFSCTKESGLWLMASESILKSIAGNLLSNAIKFTPRQGKIQVNAWREGDTIKFKVSDSGPGFSDKDKLKLFGKFQRLSAQPTGSENSTGLGLHLVKLMVDKLGGTIDLESKKGEGATFIVGLKAAQPNPRSK